MKPQTSIESISPYVDRKISFTGVKKINDWYIKTYTITCHAQFQGDQVLDKINTLIPGWLSIAENSGLPVYNISFLIIHEAREGYWILFNWWTGGEMVETRTYFSKKENSINITSSLHEGNLICVWEMEIFFNERKAWIDHIIKKPHQPAISSYLKSSKW